MRSLLWQDVAGSQLSFQHLEACGSGDLAAHTAPALSAVTHCGQDKACTKLIAEQDLPTSQPAPGLQSQQWHTVGPSPSLLQSRNQRMLLIPTW